MPGTLLLGMQEQNTIFIGGVCVFAPMFMLGAEKVTNVGFHPSLIFLQGNILRRPKTCLW